MSTLGEVLEQRRQVFEENTSHPLYSTNEHAATLRVEGAGGSVWILPWHHFVFCIHRDEGDRERLALTFVAHEIVLRGSNLGILVNEIANQRLDQLRAAPEKYRKSLGEGPFVDELQVRSLDEPAVAG
jgi:hypothetical protein